MQGGLRGVAVGLCLVILASSCSSTGSTKELEDRVAELEADLAQATTLTSGTVDTSSSSTTKEIPTTVTSMSVTSTTVTSETVPTIEAIRREFEDALSAAIASVNAVLAVDPPSVEPSELGSCSLLYEGTEVCDIVREFGLHASWTHDIVETNSIVSPYRATAKIGYTLTATVIDGAGLPLSGPDSSSHVFELSWEYVDGIWNLVEVTAPGTGFAEMGLNLFFFGVPPSEYFVLTH